MTLTGLNPWLVALALALVGGASACDGDVGDGRGDAGERSSRPMVIDVDRGTFGGFRLGGSPERARRRFGAARCAGSAIVPLGQTSSEVGGPDSMGYYDARYAGKAHRGCTLRYRGFAFDVSTMPPAGVWAIVVTDERARTTRGVRVGDSTEDVKQRYPEARCWSSASESNAACEVREPFRRLWFGVDDRLVGTDRVTSIWLQATGPRGLATRR